MGVKKMKNKEQEITFEEAVDRLEKIVLALEEGNITLDQSLQLFQEGVNLSRICSRKLEEAEQKIDILIAGSDGEITLTPAKLEENDA